MLSRFTFYALITSNLAVFEYYFTGNHGKLSDNL